MTSPIPPHFERTRVLDVDLAGPMPAAWDAAGYRRALVLVRWRGHAITTVAVACPDGVVRGEDVRAAVAASNSAWATLAQRAVRAWLDPAADAPPADAATRDAATRDAATRDAATRDAATRDAATRDAATTGAATAGAAPSWSVVVCTRDRSDDLRRCLRALAALEAPLGAPRGEVVVVDNASSDDRTARVVAEYTGEPAGEPASGRPVVRYLREDRPGLNWARARGARAARGDIVAYTDDDVVVDPQWIVRLLEPFGDSRVGAVTGLTMPLEIETEAQWLFERYGGFGRGFARRVFDPQSVPPVAAGMAGAGANVAFRRALVVGAGLFDVELDAGTVTLTGGDTYALYRLLAAGYHVVYTPDAVVWHRHRREYAPLKHTLYGYSVGGFAYLTRCLVEHGDLATLRSAVKWLRNDHARMLARVVLRRPSALPRDLVLAHVRGVAVGPWAYLRSRGRERAYRLADATAARAATAATDGADVLGAEGAA